MTSGRLTTTADRDGRVAWSWIVGTRTAPGSRPVRVACSAAERHGAVEAQLVVE
ncbi:MAG: hypothetical protein ACYDAB_16820 [bacterium]